MPRGHERARETVWHVTAQVKTEARRLRWGWLILTMAAAVTLLGLALDLRPLMPASSAPSTAGRNSHFTIGDDVPTSFGTVAVEFIRSVDGVTHRALAGASHGVSGLVSEGQEQIQVAVAVTNRGNRPLAYTVRQFHLRATIKGRTTVLTATAGDLPDGRILPDAGIEGHLDFTVPAADAVLSLTFSDPGRSAPVVIELGTVAASDSGTAHSHG